jgi:hypothetical protein
MGELSFRRAVTERNLQDIAGIALLVKYPHQRSGRVDDRFVRQTDLLPTILHTAGIAQPAGLIGSRLDDDRYRGHGDVAVYKQDGSVVAMPASRWKRRVTASKQYQLALFGSGARSLFDFGPASELRGTLVAALQLQRGSSHRAAVPHARLFAHVRTRSSFLPALVAGRLRGARTGQKLLFALNGTIVASAPTFAPVDGVTFAVMLPPETFRDGANQLEIFEWLGAVQARRVYG